MITINGLHRQFVYDVERYNDTMNNDNDNDGNPVIGPRDWKQQKLRRGFKQNSANCNSHYVSNKSNIVSGDVAVPAKPWREEYGI